MSFKIRLIFVFFNYFSIYSSERYIDHEVETYEVNEFSNKFKPFDPTSLFPDYCQSNSFSASNKKDTESESLIGAQQTPVAKFPWMVLLQYYRSNNIPFELGAGSLITNRYVLTAAHLTIKKNKDISLKTVKLCEWDRQSDSDCVQKIGEETIISGYIMVGIEKIIIHRDYRDDFKRNDISLLRLNRTITFTDYVKAICLGDSPILQNRFITAGWGYVNSTKVMSRFLLQVDLPRVDMWVCQNHYVGDPILEDRQICAGGECKKDTCQGDSGGPLMQENDDGSYVIVGITSFGNQECGTNGIPAVYTRVYFYRNWIICNLEP